MANEKILFKFVGYPLENKICFSTNQNIFPVSIIRLSKNTAKSWWDVSLFNNTSPKPITSLSLIEAQRVEIFLPKECPYKVQTKSLFLQDTQENGDYLIFEYISILQKGISLAVDIIISSTP